MGRYTKIKPKPRRLRNKNTTNKQRKKACSEFLSLAGTCQPAFQTL
jgi:hypothetical protein